MSEANFEPLPSKQIILPGIAPVEYLFNKKIMMVMIQVNIADKIENFNDNAIFLYKFIL